MVLDVNSGAIHVVDDVAYEMIRLCAADILPTDSAMSVIKKIEARQGEISQKMMQRYADRTDVDEAGLQACIEEIKILVQEKKLFTSDAFRELPFDLKNQAKSIKALCLHVAHTCNLNCEYCFASQGKYQGERALMSLDVGKRALDFLVEHSGSHVNLEVDFFGGEPLMNWEVVKALVAYGRSLEEKHHKRFRFTLTTNGVLVDDEVIDFANREMHNVVMSIDGRRTVHDALRKDYQGRGSYDVIVPKFQKFAAARKAAGKEYYVRGTFTHRNIDFTEDLLHLASLGFDQLSMEPVVCAPDDPFALTEADLPVIEAQYERLAMEMLQRKKEGHPLTFYHYMLDLRHGPCIYKRIAGCGSGVEYFAVTPWGDLYPCHQFVGDPQYLMGNIWTGITNQAVQEKFRSCNVYSRPVCNDCWARLYCAGGCAANAYHATGEITGIYAYGCALFRKRIECAILLQVVEQIEEEMKETDGRGE